MITRTQRQGTDRERGSVSLWAVLVAFCMIVIVGIAADFGGHAVAEQRARSVAFEAARASGQQVDLDLLATEGTARTDPAKAAAAANDYLTAAGVTGNVTITGDQVTVHVTGTYQCNFLSIIGVGTLPVSGSATADTLHIYEGTER